MAMRSSTPPFWGQLRPALRPWLPAERCPSFGAVGDRVQLEPYGPLSESMLWALQRRAYEGFGVVGWQAGVVPQYATTNLRFASSYATVLLGFLRDCRHRADHDPTEPIHIVELGAGPGRFGYHLLTELLDQRHHSRLRDVPIRYVLTDLADANVEFWLAHPHLAPLLDAGLLDVARFDAVADTTLELRRSGEVLTAGSLANPVAVIANYLFDSIPQDSFRVDGGELVALHAAATAPEAEADLDDPDLMSSVQLSFEDAPLDVDALDPAVAAVLDGYRQLGDSGPLLFPTSALRCLERLADLGGDRMLLLAGDKGFTDLAELGRSDEPEVVAHGTAFSLTVDLNAIGAWFEHRGGLRMQLDRPSRLHVSAGLIGFDEDGATETVGAYRRAIVEQDPIDFYTTVLEREEPETDVDRVLALLRLSGGDADVLLRHLPGLAGRMADLEDEERTELTRVLAMVWDRYFPIGEDVDLPYFLSRSFFELGDVPAAIQLLHESIEVYGPTGWTLFNLAQCLLAAGETEAADAAASAGRGVRGDDGGGRRLPGRDRRYRNFGMTSVPISSMVCMQASWPILYGLTRQRSRSTPASSYFLHASTA